MISSIDLAVYPVLETSHPEHRAARHIHGAARAECFFIQASVRAGLVAVVMLRRCIFWEPRPRQCVHQKTEIPPSFSSPTPPSCYRCCPRPTPCHPRCGRSRKRGQDVGFRIASGQGFGGCVVSRGVFGRGGRWLRSWRAEVAVCENQQKEHIYRTLSSWLSS